ncbi:MAG: helix-turn-helix domain-containing protein [Plesiomonas sp.]|uniref:helix-turn-helix domain-containing protein n=1 Tax=Plesiomonas sp. TaxID=2486279 RepID=UPI003F3CE7F7
MQLSRQDLASLFVRQGQDWSVKAISAALENQGTDVATLERSQGLKPGSMRNVFYRPCSKYEQVIAGAVGVPPELIWPSRYANKNPHIAA